MLKLAQRLSIVCLCVIPCASTLGKPPVFSIGAAAVNSRALQGGFTRYVKVLPGDTVTLEIVLRNWSPAGERLNAYQMQLEPLDFTSGSRGSIKPAGYEETRRSSSMNLDNCFVDQSNPRWLFAGAQTITLVDTRSTGYRWMSVLVDNSDAILSNQDDRTYYAGTIIMKVSDDARGTFTIAFMEDPEASLLLDKNGVTIAPLEFEGVTIVVEPDLLAVIDRLNGDSDVSVERADVDEDGQVASSDARRALELLNAGNGDT